MILTFIVRVCARARMRVPVYTVMCCLVIGTCSKKCMDFVECAFLDLDGVAYTNLGCAV